MQYQVVSTFITWKTGQNPLSPSFLAIWIIQKGIFVVFVILRFIWNTILIHFQQRLLLPHFRKTFLQDATISLQNVFLCKKLVTMIFSVSISSMWGTLLQLTKCGRFSPQSDRSVIQKNVAKRCNWLTVFQWILVCLNSGKNGWLF